MRVLCTLLLLLTPSAFADDSLMVDLAWYVDELSRPDPAFDHVGYLNSIGYAISRPGLVVMKSHSSDHLDISLRFGRVLVESFDRTLVLLGQPERLSLPVFTGVMLDRTGQIVANAKVLNRKFGTLSAYRAAESAIQKIQRYSTSEGWAKHRFEELAHVRGYGRDTTVKALNLPTIETIERTRAVNARFRRLMDLFAVDKSRPTYLLVELYEDDVVGDDYLQSLAHLTLDAPLVTVVLLQGSDLIKLRNGVFHREVFNAAPCGPELSTQRSI